MTFRLASLLIPAATLLALLCPAPVTADCDPVGPIEAVLPTAPVAFVGTVVGVDGGSARFAVEEVWAGDPGVEVDVNGTGAGGGREAVPPRSEDDRTWIMGRRYVVVPYVDGGILRDTICTATTEWRPELAELRPAHATIIDPAGDSGVTPPIVAAAAALVMLASVSIAAFRRS